MKKLLIILFVALSLSGFGQAKWNFTPRQVSDSMNIRNYLKVQGEIIRLTSATNGQALIRDAGVWKNMTISTIAYDSAHFSQPTGLLQFYKEGLVVMSDTLDGRYALIQSLTDSIAAMRVELADSSASIRADIVTSAEVSALQNVFSIVLPSSGTVAGRCVTPTEIPAGWTVAADGVTPTNLVITHSLARHIAYVSVFTVSGTAERQLFGNAAYAGIYAPDTSTLKIESLATIASVIRINLIFK